jgi:hypothetical protein
MAKGLKTANKSFKETFAKYPLKDYTKKSLYYFYLRGFNNGMDYSLQQLDKTIMGM